MGIINKLKFALFPVTSTQVQLLKNELAEARRGLVNVWGHRLQDIVIKLHERRKKWREKAERYRVLYDKSESEKVALEARIKALEEELKTKPRPEPKYISLGFMGSKIQDFASRGLFSFEVKEVFFDLVCPPQDPNTEVKLTFIRYDWNSAKAIVWAFNTLSALYPELPWEAPNDEPR